jgi:hypothetical protein
MDYREYLKLQRLWDQLGLPDEREFDDELLREMFTEHSWLLRGSLQVLRDSIAGRKALNYTTGETLKRHITNLNLSLQSFPPGIAYNHIEARRAHLERQLHTLQERLHEEQRSALRDLTYLYLKLFHVEYQYRVLRLARKMVIRDARQYRGRASVMISP